MFIVPSLIAFFLIDRGDTLILWRCKCVYPLNKQRILSKW